ncbi:response regulator [Portibacter lacus]|uniref:Transcriptional regulator n=1 Tax=Portibacter lacus TaxID=1099794 RepID=A0AA37SS73_9BACT|nr:response regulator [Portibacter lacus]GLR17195.1 transcriptional regulator [Portibacter lacus]
MKKILIIEDDQDIRENLSEILELASYETHQAKNGKVGVEIAKSIIPDLILCDVMMPELDGFGVLKIINKDPELFKIPFLFLTAKTEKESFRKGMGLGADDYITKPFDDVELLDSIEMRLKKSALFKKIDNSDAGLRTFFNEARAEAELKELSKDRDVRKYNKKDLIYEEGQIPKYLFFINSGQVKTFQTSESGKDLITHLFSKGDFFGYINLLNNEKYSENALALQNSEITLIPAEDFRLLLFKSRDFSAKFISLLANHAGHSESQLIEIAYSSVRKKLANVLLSIAAKSHQMNFRISRDDLASFTGSAKETITRTLTDFKHEGIIEVHGSEIVIVSEEDLRNMPQ